MSANNRTPGEIPAHLLENADLARLSREPGQAFIWLNTAALLDSAEEKADIKGKVNSRLVALVFDCSTFSESLVLRCGNFTRQHCEWLRSMEDAQNLLVARLGTTSSDSERNALIALVSGNLQSLHKRFEREIKEAQSDRLTTYPTDLLHVRAFLEGLRAVIGACRTLSGGSLDSMRTVHSSLVGLDTLIGNADAHITCRLLAILTNWEHAQFYVDEAVQAAAAVNAADPEFEGSEADLAGLRDALQEAQAAVAEKDRVSSKTALAMARRLVGRLGLVNPAGGV